MAKQLLLYIEGNRAIFYGGDLSAMQQVDFPQDIVRDLDVMSKEKLYALFQASIEAYQLVPTTVTIVLSSLVTFDKDLSEIPADQQQKEAQTFLDQVPFQEILPYRFTQQNKTKIIAANKDFTYAIKTALEKRGFTIAAAVSLSILQEILPELATDLNFDLILSKLDSIKQYNMLITQDTHILSPQQKERQQQQGKTSKKELFLLLGVFGVLIIILVIVAVINLAPQKPAARPQVRPTSNSNSIPPQTTANAAENSGSQSTLVQSHSQSVQGISIERKIIPTFYTITTGNK